MSQSGFIAAALLAGLVLFLAARNRLAAYTAVLFGPAPDVTQLPFAGIPVTTTGAASSPDKGGGGGGGGLLASLAKPIQTATGGGNAAANDNWIGDLESGLGDLATTADLAALL